MPTLTDDELRERTCALLEEVHPDEPGVDLTEIRRETP